MPCLLTNRCSDATPIRSLRLNHVISVPMNLPLLQMLDRFQEGRSHMVIVSRHSEEEAQEVKREIKKGLRKRLKERVGIDSSDSSSSSESEGEGESEGADEGDKDATLTGNMKGIFNKKKRKGRKSGEKEKEADVEKGESDEGEEEDAAETTQEVTEKPKDVQSEGTKRITWERITRPGREQSIPDDAVPPKEGVKEVCSCLYLFVELPPNPYAVPTKLRLRRDASRYHHLGRRPRRYVLHFESLRQSTA